MKQSESLMLTAAIWFVVGILLVLDVAFVCSLATAAP
jgi:hypothetical protein